MLGKLWHLILCMAMHNFNHLSRLGTFDPCVVCQVSGNAWTPLRHLTPPEWQFIQWTMLGMFYIYPRNLQKYYYEIGAIHLHCGNILEKTTYLFFQCFYTFKASYLKYMIVVIFWILHVIFLSFLCAFFCIWTPKVYKFSIINISNHCVTFCPRAWLFYPLPGVKLKSHIRLCSKKLSTDYTVFVIQWI